MIVLGVTGGIGSGKSTVCRFFEQLGARIFYADDEARRLMAEDADVRSQIERAFGPGAYLEDGSLDRAYLADRIFSDESARQRINRIVHPAVAIEFDAQRSEAEKEGVDLLVKEAALLLDVPNESLDAILVVTADEDVRIERVRRRDGISADAVRDRIGRQMPQEEMVARANFVIENNGSERELARDVERFHAGLIERPSGSRSSASVS